MKLFEKVVWRLANALAIVAGVALLLMMIQTVTDVLLARAFNKPIEGSLEIISAYYMVMVVFLPLAMVELRHEHINADLFVRMLPKGVQRGVYVLGGLVSLAFFGALCLQTWLDFVESYEIGEVLMGSIYVPVWPAKFSLPIGFLAISLAIVLHIAKAIGSADFDPSPPDPAAEGAPLSI